ncbi:hypothetical protein SOVF_217000, partial [Spinacia oleracea]
MLEPMLRSVMTGMLVTMERRGLAEIFPERISKFWKNWQLRVLVVVSLLMQVALILFSKLRKHNGKPLLRFIVWSAYLLADWVAALAIGVILNNVQAHPNKHEPLDDDLISFWAPFLLLHLGGPDTISAYSLEDNQLWQRRVLQLVFQSLWAVYILIIAWPDISSLSLLTIPMLLAGILKIGERIISLRSACTEHFRLSQMTEPDPGPNYSKFMEEFTLKKAEGFYVKAVEVIETPLSTHVPVPEVIETPPPTHEDLVLKAYDLFQIFKRLFVDLILSFQDRDESQCYFHSLEYKEAFEVIEIELGFAYDVFYTKAPAVYNRMGQFFRQISLSATLVVAFVFICRSKKDHFHKVDLYITYSLLMVAVILECSSFLILLFSDWSIYWLKKHCETDYWLEKHCKKSIIWLKKHCKTSIIWLKKHCKKNIICCFRHLFCAPRKRWSNLIAQYSIQNFCREKNSSRFPWFLKLLMVENKVDELVLLTYSNVSSNLKKLIFKYFLVISKSGNKSHFTALCTSRGKRVLDDYDCSDLGWSITEVDFDQSILLWHIATELCYYTDDSSENLKAVTESERTESKQMSEYMMYLLALRPFMLPMGIGMI